MANPTYISPHGGLATNRYDFESHIQGTAFRHNSNQIDVNPTVTIQGTPYSNVDGALNGIANYIASQASGFGFVIVGDGYDTWHAANGTVNFDENIPPLDVLLNPVFDAIVNNTTMPTGFEKIVRGGLIFIKAGTYIVVNTIHVPPGITLMGEGYGTKIINATSLNLAILPPVQKAAPGTTKPIFSILADPLRGTFDSAIDPNMFMFTRETKIVNMLISDNFVDKTILGDILYKLPQNKSNGGITPVAPLISQLAGSNLKLENVYMTGRVSLTGLVVTAATSYALKLDTTTPAPNGTILTVRDCFIDGFSQPLSFNSTAGTADYLEITNNKIRGYGYLNGDNTLPENNCLININDSNSSISNNYLYGDNLFLQSMVFLAHVIDDTFVTAPTDQAISRIMVSNNNAAIQKSYDFTVPTFQFLQFNSFLYFPVAAGKYFTSIVEGNHFGGQADALGDGKLAETIKFLINMDDFTANSAPTQVALSINGVGISAPTMTVPNGGAFNVSANDTSLVTSMSMDASNIIHVGSPFYPTKYQGAVRYSFRIISTNVVIDDAGPLDYLIFVTTTSARSITLPDVGSSPGRTFVIKDKSGLAGTNHITLIRDAGNPSTTIEGLTASKVLATNFGSWTLVSDGINGWYFI